MKFLETDQREILKSLKSPAVRNKRLLNLLTKLNQNR